MKILLAAAFLLLSAQTFSQTTYYISSSGNDANSGTSMSAPRKTIPKLVPKNTYLLHRGDTFYNKISRVYNPTAGNTITVGAYGSKTTKPVLSFFANISAAAWVADKTNVWKVNFYTHAGITGYIGSTNPDAGFLKLNGTTIKGAKKATKDSLATQWDFFSDGTYLYVYSASKPSLLASKIECSTPRNAIDISDNMTVQDIEIIGAGRNGIAANKQVNIIVRNVDIKEVGGCYLRNYGSGTTRFGNGIQLFNGGTNCLIEGCSIKQVYDVALTMQTANGTLVPFKNITFRNNYVDSCEQSFENTLSRQQDQPGFMNCRVITNNFRNAGYGWSHKVRPRGRGVHLLSYQWYTANNDLVFQNNTFYRAKDGLYYAQDGFAKQAIPPYISKDNDIWIEAATPIRMNYPGLYLYAWKADNYRDFVNVTQKERGSTWHSIDETANTSEVIITSPRNNTRYNDPAIINMSAEATSKNGSISKVEFYNGKTLLKTENFAPYTYSWKNVGAGNYTIIAKATDNTGFVTTSNSVTISVLRPTEKRLIKTPKLIDKAMPDLSSTDAVDTATKQLSTIPKYLDETSFKLAPNPAGNKVFVYAKGLSATQNFNILVLSMTGAILKTINGRNSIKGTEVDISSLNKGSYIIQVSSGYKKMSKTFVKL